VAKVNFGRSIAPRISPNPANSYFTIIAGAEPVKDITVLDLSGKILHHIENTSAGNVIVSSANLAAGIYIIKISTATQVFMQKLLRQ
jgi:hypothetical protein